MKRFLADMNPTLRGFLIVAAIVLGIVFLQPVAITFAIVWLVAQILFVIAIGFLIYRWWREHRGEIDLWSGRAKWTFYAAWWVIVAELVLKSFVGTVLLGLYLDRVTLLAWLLGIAICAYAMWRVWTDEHTYGGDY
jgi:hypothetical protein